MESAPFTDACSLHTKVCTLHTFIIRLRAWLMGPSFTNPCIIIIIIVIDDVDSVLHKSVGGRWSI